VSDNAATGGGCASWQPPPPPVYTASSCAWSQGGGLFSEDGTIVNSTISSNSIETGSGGGLSVSRGTVIVAASTITGNTAVDPPPFQALDSGDPGPGIAYQQVDLCCAALVGLPANGSIAIGASIVSGAEPLCGRGVGGIFGSGSYTSAGHNLSSDSTCGLTQPTDQQGVDPLLGLLADNGGPTWTHLPAAGSPAADAIPAGTPYLCDGTIPADQRGQPRPSGTGCDIGAVERQGSDP
jgi:hypothetical protein